MKSWAWMLSLVYPAVATAGTIDPSVPDEKYVEYGKKFEYVAKVECVEDEDGGKTKSTHCGSCVVVSKRHAITAAHVVEKARDWVIVLEDGSRHKAYRCVIHPDYLDESKKNKDGCFDIAIMTTDNLFGLDFYPSLYRGTDEQGKVASMAGYGFRGTFATGQTTHDGKRRGGSNIIEFTDRDLIICSNHDKPVTALEFLIASGDSGGGLFIGNSLAGIHSSVMAKDRSPCSRHGEESAHTRVSSHIDFLVKEMERDD